MQILNDLKQNYAYYKLSLLSVASAFFLCRFDSRGDHVGRIYSEPWLLNGISGHSVLYIGGVEISVRYWSSVVGLQST